MKRKLFIMLAILFVSTFVFVGHVFASNGADTATPNSLPEFLQWLIGGGGSILAVSWILERIPWFQSLTSDQRDYAIFGMSVVVGCGALAVVTYVPAEIISDIAPYFLIIASTFATVFIAKLFHSQDKTTS